MRNSGVTPSFPGRLQGFRLGLLMVGWMGILGTAWGATDVVPKISTVTVHAIAFSGNTAIPSADLEKRLSLKKDGLYTASQVQFSKDVIESVYRDKGYAEVHVSTQVVAISSMTKNVSFNVVEGAVYHIRAIKIEGNKLLSERLVQRDLGLKVGDPYSQTQIYEANKRLFLSGYFEVIDIRASSDTVKEMDIHVQLKERATQYIKGGFGYGTETKERVSLGYEDRNFLGNEKQLDLSATHSGFVTNPSKYRTSILQGTLSQPHFFGTSVQGQTGLSEEWDDRLAYNARTTAWRSSLGRHFGQPITASIRYRFQGTHVTQIDTSQAATTPPTTNISAVGPTFTYDNTNDPFLPTIGWRISGLTERGFKLGIGDLDFQRYEARAGRFDTVHGFTVFTGLQFSLVRPDHPGESIPIFERYTLGGANTVRGYEQQELGPRDAQGNPLGGNAFAVGNLELRHRLYKKLVGVWFLDGGQLYTQDLHDRWPHIQAKSVGDFAYGTGPGLRLETPVGAVRLELGYKVNPPGDPDFLHRVAIDFSLGEVF